MILVDTSVWVDHLRKSDPVLVELLEQESVLVHPFVTGELACGNIRNRAEVLDLLQRLPAAPSATDDEVLALIDRNGLMAKGVGLIDVHLLASSALADDARLWTRDKPLATIADRMGLGFRALS
ncbi:MAG: type II toxin-antitoxin system VapC family toxin [Gemmatimonadaceae bacterium]